MIRNEINVGNEADYSWKWKQVIEGETREKSWALSKKQQANMIQKHHKHNTTCFIYVV